MTDLGQLNIDYARQFPLQYARDLAKGGVTEITAVLRQLPAEVAVVVAAALRADLLSTMLQSDLPLFTEILNEATVDQAIALLNRLPREQCLALVNKLEDVSKRRKLLRFLNYPPHTVGALVNQVEQRFNVNEPPSRVVEALQHYAAKDEPVVVIVTDTGHYAGVLEVWRLLASGNSAVNLTDIMTQVRPLRAEASQLRAMTHLSWRNRSWLPVVDHQGRVLGVCQRTRLEDAVAAAGAAEVGSELSSSNIGESYMQVLSALLSNVLGNRRS